MDQDQARLRVMEDIATVGELTRMVTQRYDGMFQDFYSVLLEAIGSAPDMAAAALTAMAVADAAVGSVQSNFAGHPRFACAQGCSPCCHLFVAVPPGVADAIAAHIDARFPPAERAKLVLRLQEKVEADLASATPHMLRTPCALLDEGGSCTIYEVRPLSCRSFTSTSLPRCHQVVFGDNPDGGGVDQNPARYRLYEYATRALEEEARRRGLPARQQGLSASLLAQLRG